jgi:transcriptional regulator with XRE-family HTH domain
MVRHSAELEHLLPEDGRAERCLAPVCDSPQYAGGLCLSHYERARQGTPVVNEIPPLKNATADAIRTRRHLLGLTLEDVGGRMGVTRERVRQLELRLDKDCEAGTFPLSVKRYLEVLGIGVEEVQPTPEVEAAPHVQGGKPRVCPRCKTDERSQPSQLEAALETLSEHGFWIAPPPGVPTAVENGGSGT